MTMDRRSFTADWYRSHDFHQSKGPTEFHYYHGNREYSPSDFGDYRSEHFHGRNIGNERYGPNFRERNYAPSDTGDYRRHMEIEPSPDYIHGVPVFGQNLLPHNQRRLESKQFQRNNVIDVPPSKFAQETNFRNLAYDPDSSAVIHESPFESNSRIPHNKYKHSYAGNSMNDFDPPKPPATILYSQPPGPSQSATLIYDGKSYRTAMEGETTKPSWIDLMSQQSKQEVTSTNNCSVAVRVIVIILVIWDVSNDWLLNLSISNSVFHSGDTDTKECKLNVDLFNVTGIQPSGASFICKKPEHVWNAFAVFALLGFLVTLIQIINIGCEMIMECKSKMFQVLHGQNEILLALFFEELPQISLLITIFFVCDCEDLNWFNHNPRLGLFALLASISAAVSTTARYATSFKGVSENGSCCNTWWRCSCCDDEEVCCRLEPKNLFCTCNMPCPLCCCSLDCNSCSWTPHTWCYPLLKAFSCCTCCREDEKMYGVRLLNFLGICVLWAALAVNILIFVVTIQN